jgi:hypothetical protein
MATLPQFVARAIYLIYSHAVGAADAGLELGQAKEP